MRCNHCGSEWTTRVRVTFHECPFCGKPLNTPSPAEYRNTAHVTSKRADFDIVGTVLRAYNGTSPVVEIPEGVTELGRVNPEIPTFSGNKIARKVILPKSIRKFDTAAFSGSMVEEIVIPVDIDTLTAEVFAGCNTLRKIVFKGNIRKIGDAALGRFWERLFSRAHTKLQSIIFEGSVEEIGDSAFCDCIGLQELILPQGLGIIGNHAFDGCTALRRIVFPQGLTAIGDYAFSKCTMLHEIQIPEGLVELGDHAFSGCTELRKIELPRGLKQLGKYAFEHCSNLGEMILPWGIKMIDHGAFYNCYNLRKVVIPESVSSIILPRKQGVKGYSPFEGCTALENVEYSQRFLKECFEGSAYYSMFDQKREAALDRQRKIDSSICPECGGKLGMFSNKCKSCGRQY